MEEVNGLGKWEVKRWRVVCVGEGSWEGNDEMQLEIEVGVVVGGFVGVVVVGSVGGGFDWRTQSLRECY